MKTYLSLVLLTAIGLALVPVALASSITISASPSSGTISYFPSADPPNYSNFVSTLTVTGPVTGIPTWSYSLAPGSPSCATSIVVTFGNIHAWNTTVTFDDHAGASCGPVTFNLQVTSTTGIVETIQVQVSYVFCRNCT